VQQNIAPGQACGEPGYILHVAADEIDFGVGEYSLSFFFRSDQPSHLVSLIEQGLDQIAAQQPGSTSNKDEHRLTRYYNSHGARRKPETYFRRNGLLA